MTIQEIYHHYQIPPNLQTHMLQVAAVGIWTCEHWQDKSLIDEAVIRQTLLLHDMGNIIKFDLDAGASLMGEEAKNIDYWKEVQADFKIKFGHDDHVATIQIAKELGAPPAVCDLLGKMGTSQIERNLREDNYNAKICTYSDMRIAPHGLVTVDERFDDGIRRYKNRPGYSFDKAEKMRINCHKLEEQIQENLDRDIVELTSIQVETLTSHLEQSELL